MARQNTDHAEDYAQDQEEGIRYCRELVGPVREIEPGVAPGRMRLIRMNEKKWVNGTVFHYCFFQAPNHWRAADGEEDVVRAAFDAWRDVGIGVEFEEVDTMSEAEVRIGFQRGDGAWSYVGRDILSIGQSERTMNFGWDLRGSGEIDTAIHEIGHTLGFPHEHQNPIAGIEWNEEAVYAALAAPPNEWDRATTFHNIIRKIDPDAVQGSQWDRNSIMHYPFGPGLIDEPEELRNGLQPDPGLSGRDKEWVVSFYPPLHEDDYLELEPYRAERIRIEPGEQVDFVFEPDATRTYHFGTFGRADTVMVLFEDIGGSPRYVTGDDDSGWARNAQFTAKLFRGRRYLLRLRLYFRFSAGDTAVMLW